MKTSKNIKIQNTIQLLSLIVAIVGINIISQFYFGRYDLTSEKRYSISETTKGIIENIDDIVYVRVYLDGDLPANFKKLRNSTRELLDDLRAYNSDIMYEFINPSENDDKTTRQKLYKELVDQGLSYYNIPVENNDGYAQKTVFPSALITYREKSIALNLLTSNRKVPLDAEIDNSIQSLELKMLNTITKLTKNKIPSVVFTVDHGELDNYESGDIAYELSKMYDVGQIEIGNQLTSLMRRVKVDSVTSVMIPNFDLIIIAQPTEKFNMKDLFLIDQYIMHGGKIVWAVDAVQASMDSLRISTSTIGMPLDIGLAEILFKYGVRLNTNLVLNRNALAIGTAEGELRTWDFFPHALPVKGHIITNNLSAVKTHFVSSMDTVGSSALRKTVLLQTDRNSRLMPAPALIDLVDIIYRGPNPSLYYSPQQPIAILVEGEFTSVFENRMIDPRIMEQKKMLDITYKSPVTSQLFISDGDIIRNQTMSSSQGRSPYPLGYDRYSKRMFDNKKFILNAVNYMLGDNVLIELRNKQYKIRLLDKDKIAKDKLKWQLINTLLPIVLIISLGLIIGFIKRKKYAITK
ncbi:MAG: gliding motility-associated ABC transporter substrate-binding protein GldG [Bacteroidales bacterium]|nr:gliding motility-associated ABC transporter substrate-binding protein GldG [Bacteroidales bacterium]